MKKAADNTRQSQLIAELKKKKTGLTAKQMAKNLGISLLAVRTVVTRSRSENGTKYFRIKKYKREHKACGAASAVYALGPRKDCPPPKAKPKSSMNCPTPRKFGDISAEILELLKKTPNISRKQVSAALGVSTGERFLGRMHKMRLIHISGHDDHNGAYPIVEFFSAGDLPDVKKPQRKKAAPEAKPVKVKVPKPSTPLNRLVFVSETDAIEDAKYRKNYKPAPQRVHVGWLGAV